MYQGFYDLASGMITQRRNLNNISNNMVNIQTSGYKRDYMVSTTFDEEMLIRTGRYNKRNPADIATTSKIKSASQTITDYQQGPFEVTDGIYDFAIGGRGFFVIDTGNGNNNYTRSGTFAVDDEGFLELPGLGRVMGENNQPINIPNEEFTVRYDGTILALNQEAGADDGQAELSEYEEVGRIRIVDFDDYTTLHKEDNGLFSTNQAPLEKPDDTGLEWRVLERSNVDLVEEMTNMMSSQRALQSAAQMLKMYDSVLSKASTDVGKM